MNALQNMSVASARLPAAYVYFIAAGFSGTGGPVKIGVSYDPAERLRSLQVGHHETLALVRVIDGDDRTERWLHRKFADRRIRGEWFMFSPDMLTIVPPDFIVPLFEKPRPPGFKSLGDQLVDAMRIGLLTEAEIDAHIEAGAMLDAERTRATPTESTPKQAEAA